LKAANTRIDEINEEDAGREVTSEAIEFW